MNECLKCKSSDVTGGKITVSRGALVFRPDDMKFWSLSLMGGTEVEQKAFACMNCGLVWSSTSPEKLREFVKKHCKQDRPGA